MQSQDDWSTSLFGCCSDCAVCCTGYCLPCVLYAENGKLLHEFQDSAENHNYALDVVLYLTVCCVTNCQCILGMMRRGEIRRKYGLEESPCNDCLVHCCCHPCAQCQESREMKLHLTSGFSAAQNVTKPVQAGALDVVQYPPVPKV